MVCLKRLCKRYRCWKTLNENGDVGTGGMEVTGSRQRPPPCLMTGNRRWTLCRKA